MPEIRRAAAIVDSTIEDLSHLHLVSTQDVNQVELIKAKLAMARRALQDARTTVDQLEAQLADCHKDVEKFRASGN
jgi:hypothetical protein